MRITRLVVSAAVVVALGVTAAPARIYRHCEPGTSADWGYPYSYHSGYRVTPYWSYSSTRQPYAYQGDGSYYGLGYSGYYGDGAAGNYWYW